MFITLTEMEFTNQVVNPLVEKEPNTIPYYLDSYLFESDPTLTEEKKQQEKKRGGSGVVKLEMKDGIWTANRDIILGLNIPDYE